MLKLKYILPVIIFIFIYYLIQDKCAYGQFPQLTSNFALIPVLLSAIDFIRKKQINSLVIFLVIFQTWNMFLFPYLWEDKIVATHKIIDEKLVPEMAFFSALSIWGIYFGYIFFLSCKKEVKPYFKSKKLNHKSLRKLTICILLLGFILIIFDSLLGKVGIRISFISMIGDVLPTLILGVYTLYYLRGGRSVLFNTTIIIYVIYCFLYYIGGTLFIYSIMLVMSPLIVFVFEKRKLPIVSFLFIAVLLLPIYFTRHEYRNIGLYSSGNNRVVIGLQILKNEYLPFNAEKIYNKLITDKEKSNVDNRFEGVSYLGTVVHCHNNLSYSYQFGKTFIWLPTMIVPRVLLPIRPSQNMGDDWAEFYHIKEKTWKASINFPMLVEFYCNFGWYGMVILSFFQGYFINYCCAKFNNGFGDINLLFLLFLIPKMIIVEANITLAFGFIIQVMFILFLYCKLNLKNKFKLKII